MCFASDCFLFVFRRLEMISDKSAFTFRFYLILSTLPASFFVFLHPDSLKSTRCLISPMTRWFFFFFRQRFLLLLLLRSTPHIVYAKKTTLISSHRSLLSLLSFTFLVVSNALSISISPLSDSRLTADNKINFFLKKCIT